jgi:putative nucleotidyltransferase with HDIG domain
MIVVMSLGGPTAAGWVALLGTTDLRELRREIPWYGTLVNHAALALPAIAGGLAMSVLSVVRDDPVGGFLATVAGASVYFVLNAAFAYSTLSLRTGQPLLEVFRKDTPAFFGTFLALAPLAWLMTKVYVLPGVGWWAILLVILPVYMIRLALGRYMEIRELFTQTVASLAQAVDARDKFTSGHSVRVKKIAVDIGRAMRLSEADVEALEWGGLLHDIGKIGVPDAVLNKPDRLTREERIVMNAHPVIGANIIAPVEKLAPELPIIRHHHEWFNGSGYPDRLLGMEIPLLARILHVADAFEAMTAARPYRMKPLTAEQALAELRRFGGIQFDPDIVEAFTRTSWVAGVADSGRDPETRTPVPLIGEVAGRPAQAPAAGPLA